MPIFDDPRRELNRLQQELLEEEEVYEEYEEEYLTEEEWLDEEIAEAKALLGMDDEEEESEIYRNYANGYGRRQPQPVRYEEYRDVEEAEDEEEEILVDDTRGQRILTFLLVSGILAVAAYWVVVLL